MRIIVILLVLLFTSQTQAQQKSQNLPSDLWLEPESKNFADIQQNVEGYFIGKEKGRGTGYKQWKRWEENNYRNVDVNGIIVNVAPFRYGAYQREMKKLASNAKQRNSFGDFMPWSANKYVNAGSWSPGIGRVSVIAFHPTDPNTIYAGTPAGGLFRTTNHGNTWTCLTDELASIGISGIVIHPDNPDNIYILTGDGAAGHTRSIGVYKTTNGGTSWSPTGLTWSTTENIRAWKLIMEPNDPTHMLVAASDGLYRTTDSGVTWTAVLQSTFRDIEYKPQGNGPHNVVYACTPVTLSKSTDFGATWTIVFQSFGADRLAIGVTPDDNNNVYLVAGPGNSDPGFQGFFLSTDSGDNFNEVSDTPNILGGGFNGTGGGSQSWRDLAIWVAPDDKDKILVGGVNIWESSNTGTNWNMKTYWRIDTAAVYPNIPFLHADQQQIIDNPLNGRLYSANDGGILFSTDRGGTWTDISEGLNISQIRHFDGKDQDPSIMLAGMQDNGSSLMTKDLMSVELGADGSDCLFHPTDENIMYAMQQFGALRKTIDKGQNWFSITPLGSPIGPFVTRWDMDKNNPDTIYVGWTNSTIFRTFDGGANWTQQQLGGVGANITSISITDNGSTIYASTVNAVFRSFDRGDNWSTIYSPFSSIPITSVAKVGGNPARAIITRGSFGGSISRVLLWDDDNDTVTAIESPIPNSPDTLPAMPVNISATSAVNGLFDIYVGTAIGVYHFSYLNPVAGWKYFKAGLPNVPVTDLRIYDEIGILRVATFGRGIWESDVYNSCEYNKTLTQANDPSGGAPGSALEEASDIITSSRLILGQPANNVIYKGSEAVILTTGFLAQEGATFRAGNKPCGVGLD